ncbi:MULTISPECIES: LacI family DNA-binding transcriptional regulator [Ralstonia solanacearum species complex]|uniref:LacI family DNA-binding transcriptional regulator n=1 Tax=Ralstonia solanacearum species complex TaxID=3116862 RepID=UPI000E594CF0|nr:LacI family DNA-binding transcriptional regulator [Ralstonia solanacearum]BEU73805.1 LacI family DNA-binding transcriptional regulator [Ralstonia pseudosolanacearum]AXV78739.1 DNA-binding protein [Ralstonia solanacearum]AXV92762.1 DNA-binding protein [Ralstonia solanacearum]AXW20835.1 DNA-binding protein [Ralstonia solanacearum]AXW77658.1 DNA-binding protein [Ralstonia solanacearum]
MSHRFLIKEIALQAGVGVATVDRVLNGRAHVREHTRKRVEQAIRELEKQALQLAMAGRKLIVDVVVEAPSRFANEILDALEAELPGLHPAVFRPRFLMRETMTTEEVVGALQAIGRRGSYGVFLKARDIPEISNAIGDLQRQGIPVVTMFTDIPLSGRIAYAGPDNRIAGATAAYLVGQWLGKQPGNVLITMSDERFRGEEEREISFRRALRTRFPQLTLIDASGGHGLDDPTGERVRSVLAKHTDIAAVYSMGGGNLAILRALQTKQRYPACFIGHDLDRDNVRLLREGKVQVILHHELRQDMRSACQQVMCFHKLLPAAAVSPSSSVVVVTPENIPQHIASRFRR